MTAATDGAVAAAAGVAAAVGGTVLGIPGAALVGGLCGGLTAVLAIPPGGERPRKGVKLYLALAGSVVASVIAAGALGELAGIVLRAALAAASITGARDQLMTLAGGFAVGAGVQAGLLMTAIEALRRRIAAIGGRSR